MFELSDAEKIETVTLSALRGCREGHLGKAVSLVDTRWNMRIEIAGGPVVLVRTNARNNWEVMFKGFVGEDRELYAAARLALDAGEGVNVTRNYPIG